jgi:hypothetical protein
VLKNHPNVAQLELVAAALDKFCDMVTFVGGATVPLYVEDEAAWFPTPTVDVDCVVEFATRVPYFLFEMDIRELGFRDPSPDELENGAPICRKYLRDLPVDIMPTDPSTLGFGNKWYAAGVKKRISLILPSGKKIFCFSIPYFFATKIEAYKGRGIKDDLRCSQDLEDLINVMDGVSEKTLVEAFSSADDDLFESLRMDCSILMKDRLFFKEAVVGFIRDELRADRVMRLLDTCFSCRNKVL